jgi:hypothetical protein
MASVCDDDGEGSDSEEPDLEKDAIIVAQRQRIQELEDLLSQKSESETSKAREQIEMVEQLRMQLEEERKKREESERWAGEMEKKCEWEKKVCLRPLNLDCNFCLYLLS